MRKAHGTKRPLPPAPSAGVYTSDIGFEALAATFHMVRACISQSTKAAAGVPSQTGRAAAGGLICV